VTIGTSNALTVGGNYTPNVALHRSAVQLITRAPAMPMDESGRPADSAEDTMLVTDPVSGITFEVSMYRQFRQLAFFVSVAWGTACIKNDNVAILMG
jgi:hypothetical protein